MTNESYIAPLRTEQAKEYKTIVYIMSGIDETKSLVISSNAPISVKQLKISCATDTDYKAIAKLAGADFVYDFNVPNVEVNKEVDKDERLG